MTVTPPAPDPTTVSAESAEDAIKTAVKAAAGLGVPGLFHPALDELGMGAIWLTMVTKIAQSCGAELSAATAGKFVGSALSSVAAYRLGSKILTYAISPLLLAFPVAGIPAAAGVNAALNGLFTHRLGKECIRTFSSANFTSGDAINLGRRLVGIPTLTEIGDIKELLLGT